MNTILSTVSLASLLLMGGCMAESHQLLSEEAIGERTTWSDCDQALNEGGRHMDACTFDEGSGCGTLNAAGYGALSSCVGGDLLRADYDVISRTAPNTDPCEGALPLDSFGGDIELDVQATSAGCAEVHFCRYAPADPEHRIPESGELWATEVCAHAPVTVPSVGARVWIDCEGLIQEARDGDPCTPGLACAGDRELMPGHLAGPLLAWCDDGQLRLVDITLVANPAAFE